jgi:hypothetical protein
VDGSRRSWWLLFSTFGVLAAGTTALLLAGAGGVNVATVLALPVGIIGALFGLVALVSPARPGAMTRAQQLHTAARELAQDVWETEANEFSALLRPLATPADEPTELFHTKWIDWQPESGATNECVPRNETVEQLLGDRRLVVLGQPGAGKTVLAIQLVRDLAERARGARTESDNRVAVPVRLSLSTFKPTRASEKLEDISVEQLSARLDEWLVQRLIGFRTPRRTAASLVERGWIVPVLDGLDEMDDDRASSMPRAAAVIEALNYYLASYDGLRRVVLTCRSDRYSQLGGYEPDQGTERESDPARRSRGLGTSGHWWVTGARVIELLPLEAPDVIDELSRRFPGEDRWGAVIDRLSTCRPDDALVRALCSPLRLYLAVTAYRRRETDPGEMTTFGTTEQIDERLFRLLIPELIRQRQRRTGGRPYDAKNVQRWLTTVALYLKRRGGSGISAVDLQVGELWAAAAPRSSRVVTTILLTAAALAVAGLALHLVPGNLRNPGPIGVLVPFISIVIMYGWLGSPGGARGLDLFALRRSAARSRLIWSIGRGALAGGAAGTIIGLVRVLVGHQPGVSTLTVIEDNVEFWVLAGIAFGLVAGMDVHPSAACQRQLVTQGLAFTGAVVVGCSVFGGFFFGLIWGDLVPFGLAAGFICGIAVAAVTSVWPRYATACLLQACRGTRQKLPARPATFLDWAHGAGLVRQAGTAVQFRHLEFQDWLVAQHDRPREDLPMV